MAVNPPWAGKYGAAVAIALLGLCPYIVLTTASLSLTPLLTRDLGTTSDAVTLVDGLANAGYAVGAVVAAYLAQRLLQRRLFLAYEAAFVVGSVLAAVAPGLGLFAVGRVVQGAATGLMLVSALPPLVTRFGAGRLPVTVVLVNIGLFGATTVGPLIGGPLASAGVWRPLFVGTAVLGALGLAVAALGYARFDPPDPDLQLDRPVFPLAVAGTFLPFFATSSLVRVGFTSPVFLVPFVVGLLALGTLIVLEYRKNDALMPVEALSTQLPVTGTVVAMVGGAVFISVLILVQLSLTDVFRLDPGHAGLLLWPLPVGLVVASGVFGLLFRTRWVPVLVNVGLLALLGGTALLLLLPAASPGPVVGGASALLGFGAGATVSPGLFLAALGVPSSSIGRAFALVELLRSEAAFAVAPVVATIARGQQDLRHGIAIALVAMLVLAFVGLIASLAIPLLSGARLHAPDLEAWLERGEPALPTPVTMSLVRSSVKDDVAEPLPHPGGRR